MKIAVIGPISPYRGGISHSNTVLCKNLSRRNSVTPISFKRMFPKLLYPGKTQKDPAAEKPKNMRILDVLDSINPLNWISIYRFVKKEKFDLLAFQWWSPFFTPSYTTIAWLVRKFTKTRVSVVCQNVTSHEDKFLDRFLTGIFFRKADFFITYSSSDKKDVKKLIPKAKVEYIVEGTYDMQLGKPLEKARAKKSLGFKGKNIMFFGFVRDYKGLPYLLKALPLVLKNHDVTLHIVGEFWEDKNQYLKEIESLGIKNRVKIVDRYVSDKEAVAYFSASDAVVLPYTSSTESGIIQLAYGLNTPVITTDVGGNKDLIEEGKTGLLATPKNPEDLAKKITLFYSKSLERKIKAGMEKNKAVFLWTKEKERKFFGI